MSSLILFLGCLAASACKSDPPQVVEREGLLPRRALALDSWEYRVGPADLLRVNVFNHPELSSAELRDNMVGTPVDGEGYIMLPLLGAVEVGGMTVREIATFVESKLANYLKEPHVDVAVVEYGAHRFLVLGEVELPGAYPISRPTTVMEALALAGGFSQLANRDNVAWVRGTIDQASLQILDGSELDPLAAELVAAGDVIFVGQRDWADVSEAARDLIPVIQTVSIPLSVAIQAATLAKID